MTLKNTDNSYIIEVRNTQTIDGAKDIIEERAGGRYYERGEKKYIVYDTPYEGGVTTSTVIVSDGCVTVRRRDGADSRITLDLRHKTVSPYYTPYGVWEIEARTERIISTLDEDGGELKLKYTLTIQGGKYHNDMVIKVIGDKR